MRDMSGTLQVYVSRRSDPRSWGGTEACNWIKKEMLMEMKRLGPEEQVLLIGCSAAPQMCVKKDEKAFMGFFDKHIYLPLPRYASRLVRLVSCFYSCLCVCGCCTWLCCLSVSTSVDMSLPD